jgi:hypothetical protein
MARRRVNKRVRARPPNIDIAAHRLWSSRASTAELDNVLARAQSLVTMIQEEKRARVLAEMARRQERIRW